MHDLQRCLFRHPILFGAEYIRVIPKFSLGGDFEMDFALQRSSGLIDMVEIENSKHALFTKNGNPRSQLVHAEQQVIDWHSASAGKFDRDQPWNSGVPRA